MVSHAHIEDAVDRTRLALHGASPCAVASLQDGALEAVLDRRMTADDGKGLEQGMQDNVLTRLDFALTLEAPPKDAGAVAGDELRVSLLSRHVVCRSAPAPPRRVRLAPPRGRRGPTL